MDSTRKTYRRQGWQHHAARASARRASLHSEGTVAAGGVTGEHDEYAKESEPNLALLSLTPATLDPSLSPVLVAWPFRSTEADAARSPPAHRRRHGRRRRRRRRHAAVIDREAAGAAAAAAVTSFPFDHCRSPAALPPFPRLSHRATAAGLRAFDRLPPSSNPPALPSCPRSDTEHRAVRAAGGRGGRGGR